MSNPERPHKRSPKEIIEEAQPANVEHAFVKRSAGEAQYVGKGTGGEVSSPVSVFESGVYNFIHTHPSKISEPDEQLRKTCVEMGLEEKDLENVGAIAALHSVTDIGPFLSIDDFKFATIAVRDPESGELLGYNVLKKTAKTPHFVIDTNSFNAVWKSAASVETARKDLVTLRDVRSDSLRKNSPSLYKKEYDSFLKKYGLKSRLVPAEGYKVNEYGTAFIKKES